MNSNAFAIHGILLGALTMSACKEVEYQSEAETVCFSTSQIGTSIAISGGTFVQGADPIYSEEGPPTQVYVADFWIDVHEVTNTQFAQFVAATGYVTEAEQPAAEAGQLPPEMRQPGSAVFVEPDQQDQRWWRWIKGAQWRHPTGPSSNIEGRDFHPVVHVTYEDALAYARWKGGRLPTETEWEFAARAGNPNSLPPTNSDGLIEANHYQGVFPARDIGGDGFIGTAPVGCFEPNAFGLHDMIGNVWEWTDKGHRVDDATIKGGSFLCADNYCRRYRPSARQFHERDLGTSHIGFRVVYDVP